MHHLYLLASATPPPAANMNDAMGSLFTLILLFAGMYFLIIAPQRQKEKELKKLLNELKKGDEVTTIGGIVGTIEKLTDDKAELRVNDKVTLTFVRTAIQSKVTQPEDTKNTKDSKAAKKA